MIFYLVLFAFSALEIFLFYLVGSYIGLLYTLLLCLLTAVFGGFLFKWQGLSTLWEVGKALSQRKMPVRELFDGACILVAGALLVTPGFATDVIGFSLFIPAVRSAAGFLILARFDFVGGILERGRGGGRADGASYKKSRRMWRAPDGLEKASYKVNDDPIDVKAEHVDDKSSGES